MFLLFFCFIVLVGDFSLLGVSSSVVFSVSSAPNIILEGNALFPIVFNLDEFPIPGETCYVSDIGKIIIVNNSLAEWSLSIEGETPGIFALISGDKMIKYQMFTDISKDGATKVGTLTSSSGLTFDVDAFIGSPREILNPGIQGNLITASTHLNTSVGIQLIISGEHWAEARSRGAFDEDTTFKDVILWTFIQN